MAGLMEHIRNMDERSRSRIATACGIAVSAVVLAVWIAYFPNFIRRISGNENRDDQSSFSLLQTIKGGSAMMKSNFEQLIETLRNRIGSPKEYTIQAK